MEQTEFLENKIFTGLKNLNNGSDNQADYQFSESDFEIVLQRVEHFGIGLYKIETWLEGELYAVVAHEEFKKKATDPKWYKKAFLTFKLGKPGLVYAASYKVSNKLLAK